MMHGTYNVHWHLSFFVYSGEEVSKRLLLNFHQYETHLFLFYISRPVTITDLLVKLQSMTYTAGVSIHSKENAFFSCVIDISGSSLNVMRTVHLHVCLKFRRYGSL
jgi:hypothetical protein